jgi:purine nucleosidase
MQAGGRGGARPPIGIAFEGDLGNRIDAVLAVAMLNGFITKSESRTIALCVSHASIKSARLADVLAGFYAPRPVGGVSMVGMPERPVLSQDAPPLAEILAKTAPDGTPLYTSNIATVLDTADNAVHIRNVLLAQFDGNAAVVIAGPATGAARLVGLFGARPQIEAKVARLVLAMGTFNNGAADPAVKADIAAARKVLAEWPTEIIAVGTEVGAALPYPATSIEADLAWTPAHPVADAYRLFRTMPYDAPTTALAATLHAVHPTGGYFQLSDPGTITVMDDGRTQFTPGAGGRHRHLIVDPAQKDRVMKLYTEMVSARPAPRPGRRGGPPPAAAQPPQQPPLAPPPPTAKPPAR